MVREGTGSTADRPVRRSVCTLIIGALLAGPAPASANNLLVTPSVTLSEEYNDNIYFLPNKTYDFITRLRLGANLSYNTENSTTNSFLGTSAVYLARSANTTVNLAEAQRANLSTSYRWSPRLSFSIANALARVNDTRDIGFVTGGGGFLPPPQGENDPADNNNDVNVLLPRGSAFTNSFNVGANYALAPRWSLGLAYGNGVSNFTEPDDTDLTQRWSGRLGYQLTPALSVGGGFAYSRFNSNTSPDVEGYTATVGGNYQISELWNAFGAIGGSVRRGLEPGAGGTSGSTTFNVGLNRQFDRSFLTVGAQQGLTPGAGIVGASVTLGAYAAYGIQLTARLNGAASAAYTHFDGTTGKFQVVTARASLAYPIWETVSAAFVYVFRSYDITDAPPGSTSGDINANAVRIQLVWSEPLWSFDL